MASVTTDKQHTRPLVAAAPNERSMPGDVLPGALVRKADCYRNVG